MMHCYVIKFKIQFYGLALLVGCDQHNYIITQEFFVGWYQVTCFTRLPTGIYISTFCMRSPCTVLHRSLPLKWFFLWLWTLWTFILLWVQPSYLSFFYWNTPF